MAWLVDPVATKERSTTKRKVISLVKVGLFFCRCLSDTTTTKRDIDLQLVKWYCGMEVEKGDERVSNWEWNLNKRQIDCEYTYSFVNG